MLKALWMKLFGEKKHFDVSKLKLQEGDVIIISTVQKLSAETATQIDAYLKVRFPDNEIVILADGYKLSVISNPPKSYRQLHSI